MKLTNSITTLEDANLYVQNHYSFQSCLEPVTVGKKTKYRFVNVDIIARFPYPFKTVKSAMNCLFAHEQGWIAARKRKRLNCD